MVKVTMEIGYFHNYGEESVIRVAGFGPSKNKAKTDAYRKAMSRLRRKLGKKGYTVKYAYPVEAKVLE